jgi:hypothetical protein
MPRSVVVVPGEIATPKTALKTTTAGEHGHKAVKSHPPAQVHGT